jgi:hypothetical protein
MPKYQFRGAFILDHGPDVERCRNKPLGMGFVFV